MKKTVYPCLWFNDNASEAAHFYCSVFKDSHVVDENPLAVTFESSGNKFMCLNGGPQFSVNPSISFYVVCESIEEVDQYWKVLTEGGIAMIRILV